MAADLTLRVDSFEASIEAANTIFADRINSLRLHELELENVLKRSLAKEKEIDAVLTDLRKRQDGLLQRPLSSVKTVSGKCYYFFPLPYS